MVQAQDSVVYEFDLVLSENQLIDQGISSRFDDLVVGTPGSLRIEVESETTDFSGTSTESSVFYKILQLDFSAGSVHTTGTPGVYPSQTFASSMNVANDSLVSFPDIYVDQFASFLSLADPDISLALILFGETGAPGEFPSLFTDTTLPSADTLSAAPTQSFFFQTPFMPSARIKFDFVGFESTGIPAPSSGSVLVITGLLISRRRR